MKSKLNNRCSLNLGRQLLRNLEVRKEGKYQHFKCLQYPTPSMSAFNSPIAATFTSSNNLEMKTVELANKRNRFVRHYSSTTIPLPSSTSSSKYKGKNGGIETSKRNLSSQPFSFPRNNCDNESFRVRKVNANTGEIETLEMTQTEIMAETSLLPRDLVSLRLTTKKELRESWIGHTLVEQMRYPPSIVARNDFILLSLGPLRAVAGLEAVYVFDVHNKNAKSFANSLSLLYRRRSDRMKSTCNSDIAKNLCFIHNEEPSELVFLESVLADAIDSFSSRICIFEAIVNDLLLQISTDEEFQDANLVHQMAPLKEQLKSFEIFVSQTHHCLMQLLNDDEAMLQLLLTEQEGMSIDCSTISDLISCH